MKKRNLRALTLIYMFLVGLPSVYAISTVHRGAHLFITNDNILGSWAYQVQGVDPAYQNGIMNVTKADGLYIVNLDLHGNIIPTEDVEVNGNELKFAVYVEGQRVEVTMLFEGAKLTGQGSSDEGPFTITGSRRIIPK